MCLESLYNFFNNATVGALIAVGVAAVVGSRQYRKQKDIDREQELKQGIINDFISLNERANYALLIIDRIANSYSVTNKSDPDFLKALKEYEIPKLSNAINEEIPFVHKKIEAKISIYFKENSRITAAYGQMEQVLKNWHDPIVSMKVDLKERATKQPALSLKELNEEIKKIIDLIWKSKIV